MPAAIACRGEAAAERLAVEQDASAGDRHSAEQRAADRFPGRRRAGRRDRPPRRRGSRSRPGRLASIVTASRTRRGCALALRGRRKTCDGSRPTISRIASSGVVFVDARARRRRGRRAGRPCGRRSRTPRRAGARRRSCRRRASRSRRSAANSRATSSAGRLAVGSSSTRISASAASARAMATSDFSVRLRLWMRTSGSMSAPSDFERRGGAPARRAPSRSCRRGAESRASGRCSRRPSSSRSGRGPGG